MANEMIVQPGTPAAMVQAMLARKKMEDQVAAYKDTVSHGLYDTAILKGGGAILTKDDYELFTQPIGAQSAALNDAASTFTKTEEHTNISEARRLSHGRAFSVFGMYANLTVVGNADVADSEFGATANPNVAVEGTISAVSLLQDLQHCVGFSFVSDETKFERGKLRRFTSPQGISGFAGSSANNTVANNGMGRGYRLPVPRDIFGDRDFGVVMRVFRNIIIPRTVRIEFVLDGFLLRPAR